MAEYDEKENRRIQNEILEEVMISYAMRNTRSMENDVNSTSTKLGGDNDEKNSGGADSNEDMEETINEDNSEDLHSIEDSKDGDNDGNSENMDETRAAMRRTILVIMMMTVTICMEMMKSLLMAMMRMKVVIHTVMMAAHMDPKMIKKK